MKGKNNMAVVEIFWRGGCGFCTRVMELLDSKGVTYASYNIWESSEAKQEMNDRVPNVTSVPQVFIHGQHVGGCDDTFALENSGKLDELLSK